MGDVIVLSSDSEDEDSDVEIVGSFRHFETNADPPPLSEVRVDVDALNVNVPAQYINLTDPEWTLPDLKLRKRKNSTPLTVVDLTENDTANGKEQETPDNRETKKGIMTNSGDTPPEQDRGSLIEKETHFQATRENLRETTVKLKRIQLLETLVSELKPSSGSDFLNKGHTPTVNQSDLQTKQFKAEEASDSSNLPHQNISGQLPLSMPKKEDKEGSFGSRQYGEDLDNDSPPSFLWQEGIDEGQVETESRFDLDFRAATQEDKSFVCPVALRKIMSEQAQILVDEEREGFGSPKVLCRQSLSLVYSTIDENYQEGTLQLLSDLLRPGYYPPRNITFHLLHGILLDPQCPYHQCVQAFNLLMRTQRHRMADKTTVPWVWESLTTVITNQEPQNLLQDHTKKHQTAVVRMLLEYIVQTLEDDFQAKRSSSTVHLSIAKATLSCDKHFPRVRDVMQWLISAIGKSTETKELPRERDEQIRMVSILQRMLSLAVEVDLTPALTSAKLSQELFHMLISSVPLRAHRMLLLESLQSKLLRCKLLEHLLDYACPQKISLPMSLSLLLHFLKYCTLAPDPTDDTEKWKRWEELVHLLWMMMLSYNKAMKGYLCSTGGEQGSKVGSLVYKKDDEISKAAVREAVEAFMSRSKADLNQDLPLHVEESLTYLQDYLLDACLC